MVTKEELKAAFALVDLKVLMVRAAATLKLEDVPKEKLDRLVYMATHCALNGPVGVKKVTNFPGKADWGEVSIKGTHDPFTNATWKTFVGYVVDLLDQNSDVVKNSYCVKNFAAPWPRCDAQFKAKPKKEDATAKK